MKKIIFTTLIIVGFTIQAIAYDFISGNLLYTIVSTNPPCVSLYGHVDGENAQGELAVPVTVEHEGVVYTVTEISDLAFRNCAGLTGALTLPATISIIGEGAFFQCLGFTSLVLPEGLWEIREQAFSGCTGFTGNLVLPETVTHIKYGAFHNCSGFSGDLVLPNSVVEVGHTINESYYIVPQPDFYTPTFADCFDHLVLSQSLDTIGMYCFAGCTRMTGDLVMPDGLKAVFNSGFEGCTGFTSLTLNDSLAIIGQNAFGHCSGITGTLAIPENVSIRNSAFEWCEGIEGLVLPHNITFAYYSGSMGSVFKGCKGLTELDIPEGWSAIVRSNFAYCTNLSRVDLPESIISIDNGAFSNCTSLEEINIPEGVTAIGSDAFLRCRSLEHIELPSTLRVLGAAFAGCTSLTGEMVIPDLVQCINSSTFDSCYMLNRIVFGDSVNWIEEPAFEHTELSSLVLKPTTPPRFRRMTSPNAWHFPVDIPVIVPCGTLEAYRNAEGWNVFTNFIEDCTSVDESSKDSIIVSCYPNPAKEQLCFEFSPDVQPIQVELYDLQGRLVHTQHSAFESIDMSLLPAGTYMMRVIMEDGKSYSDKVVKE